MDEFNSKRNKHSSGKCLLSGINNVKTLMTTIINKNKLLRNGEIRMKGLEFCSF